MTAFYNEIDPFKAAWLRELIKAGHIAPGIVDERDIRDIAPTELTGFTQCHFFAGIGIWSYALRRAGWPDDRPVWTGSCPCQPFSSAGKGDGFDDERHLWPAWHWLIGQSRVDVVLGEQVASPDGLAWLDLVSADMEGEGYSGGAGDLCSAGVGASDIRQRLYMVWMGNAARERHEGGERGDHAGARTEPADRGDDGRLVDAPGAGRQGHGRRARGGAAAAQRTGEGHGMADTDRAGAARQRGDGGEGAPEGGLRPGSADRGGSGGLADSESGGRGERGLEAFAGDRRHADGGDQADGLADASRDRAGEHARELPGDEGEHEIGAALGDNASLDRRAAGGVADADLAGQRQGGLPEGQRRPDEGTAFQHGDGETGRMADPDGALAGDRDAQPSGQHRQLEDHGGAGDGRAWANPLKGFWADADWLLCRDGWWRPVEPGTFPLAHGAPARVGRLRGYGEGINAEVAATFIREVMELL